MLLSKQCTIIFAQSPGPFPSLKHQDLQFWEVNQMWSSARPLSIL